jgi:hypothetical protein
MTGTHPVPPLPQPRQPAPAARALAEAAYAAAGAWLRPLDPARHSRAVSQLCASLRDAGVAARGLAAWQPAGSPTGEFARYVTAAAGWLLTAWNLLDGAVAAEGIGPLPYPDEPGAELCRAARNTGPAWRHPAGTAADRDMTLRALITAAGFLSAGALALAAWAPPQRTSDLHAACASISEAAAYLAAAVRETELRDPS